MQNPYMDRVVNRPIETQNGHYPPNNIAQDAYMCKAPTYYPPPGHFDHLTNAQSTYNTHPSYMPPNAYQQHHHHHHHHDHQQQQLHTVNNYANEYAAGFQNMPTNGMPLAYNDFNNFDIPLNRQDHATTAQTCPMDANSDTNLPNSSDIAQINTAELFDAAVGITNYTDGLASNVEAQLSIE